MFLMSCAILVIAPMIPTIQQSRGFAVASLGVIAGTALVVGVVSELFLGPLADRGYERTLLISSVVVAAAALVGSGLAHSVILLTAWRAIAGIAYGMFVPAASAIVIRENPEGVGERLARLQVAEYAGFAAGPFLGALLLSRIGATAGLVYSGVACLAVLPFVVGVRIPTKIPIDEAADPESPGPRAPLVPLDLLRQPAVWVALALSVAITAPVGTYDAMWARFLADRGASAFLIAVSLGLFVVPFIILAPRAGRLIDRVGPLRGSVVGTIVVAVVVFSYGVIGSVAVIIAVGLLESAGQALAGPGSAAAMARATGPERAGAGQGLSRGIGFLGAGLVAFVAGPVYAVWGARALFGGTAAIMLVLVAVGWFCGRRWAPELGAPLDVEPTSGTYVELPGDSG
jgi:MFS family permease